MKLSIKDLFPLIMMIFCGQIHASATELHITATLPALGQIAQGVAGEFGEVKVLAHVGQDPHFVPPKPTLARHLAHADLLLAAGLGLEIGWLPPLLEAAGNDNIRPGGSGYLDGTQVLAEVLGKPHGKITRALGDIHPEGNPHWYIDPINAVQLAQVLAEKLAALDPAHAVQFRQHAADFSKDVQTRMPGWQTALQAMSPLVSYHNSYLYLVQRFGLKVTDFVEPKPGIEPSTAHLDTLVRELQQGSATSLWMEPYHDGKTARKVCELGHIPCRVMPDAIQGDGFAGYLHLIDVIAAGGI